MNISLKKLVVFAVLIALIVSISMYFLLSFSSTGFFSLFQPMPNSVVSNTKATPIVKSEVIELIVPDCNQCVSFELFKKQLKDLNRGIEWKKVVFDSSEGKSLIEKYSIESVPTIILKNIPENLFNNWADIGSIERDGVLVYRARVPVYWDLKEKRFVGAVKIIELIDSSCTGCFEPLSSPLIKNLFSLIKIVDFKRIDVNSDEGIALTRKHFIDFVPALIFSREISDYNMELFSSLGSFSPDGSFVIRQKMPPYKDLSTGETRGLLSLTIIENSSCWACKDARDMLNFLNTNLGLTFSNLTVFDVNAFAAKKFIEDHGIQYLPAAIVTGDTKSYELFKETWPKIGRVFADNSYVLDGFPFLGAGYYYDVNTGKPVLASQQQ